MPRASDARQKMIESAAVLFRERGVSGTSLTDVLEHSGAPRGSIYHHFPGGKAELAEAAVRYAGEYIVAGTAEALREDDPVAAIRAMRRQWDALLRRTDYRYGCPIVAAALEGEREPAARDTAGEVFGRWESVLAGAFAAHGLPRARARSIATLVIASVEGAIIMARADHSTRPLERVTRELEELAALALPRPAATSEGT